MLPAYAHAVPVEYSIRPNTIIADRVQVPQQLSISFSERPDPNISYIRIMDSQGVRVDNNDFTVTAGNSRQASVTIDTAKMGDGIYSVSWFTMSLDDGHITQGAYVFGVGDVTVDGEDETTYVTSFADALVKWPLIVAQAAAVGMATAAVLLGKGLSPDSHGVLARLLLACSPTIAAAATGLLFLQAVNLSEAAGSYSAAIESLISGSPAGVVWIIRIASAAAIGGLAVAYLARTKNILLLGVIVAGASSIFSNSMLSHNSAAPFMPEIAVAADWVHFMAVSAWVGGLFYLSAVFVPHAKRLSDAARVLALSIPRFSLIATMSLGVIGITGIYMAWVHLHSPDSLFTTEYGNSLAFKLTAALSMVLLGAYHQIRLHKSIVVMATVGGQGQHAVTTFSKTVKLEAVLGIGVLLAASVLTVMSPPAQALAGEERYVHRVTIDDTDATFEISPFRPGFNTFTVRLEQDGAPANNIHHVTMRFTNEDARIGPIVVTLDHAGESMYSATGGYLSREGEWKIDFIAQRTGSYDLNHTFRETLGSGEPIAQVEPELDSFAGLAIALGVAVVGGSSFYAVQSRRQMKRTLAALQP